LRYRPIERAVVRVDGSTPDIDVASVLAAANVAGVPVDVVDDDGALLDTLARVERVRILAAVAGDVLTACHAAGVAVDRTPVTHDGRVELPCWVREQAISWTVHRHGRTAATHQDGPA
jgi:RHH-type proline utilization regulon transcriptional repressor/proline dehydrogenase/delta 1-pyrroline-5-carboxylate dehydrogenase